MLFGGCGITDAPAPDPDRFINMAVIGGAEQVGLPQTQLAQPLSVRLQSTITDEPIRSREVTFTASTGSGIVFNPARAITDTNGIARTQVRLGNAIGRHVVQITFEGNPGAPATATIEAAMNPVIAQVAPAAVVAGSTIVITGENFSTQPQLNEVVIDGSRAQVLTATSTRIEARLSACLPTRAANVTVNRGALVSGAARLDVTATTGTALNPVRGQAIAINDATGVSCLRIPAQPATAEYLVITQHAANSGTQQVPFRLVGLRTGSSATTQPAAVTAQRNVLQVQEQNAAQTFRAQLHERQTEIVRRMRARPQASEQLAADVPAVGHRRDFRVFVPRRPAAVITAVARAVGTHVVIYEDVEAANSVPQSDIENVLRLLDDPIFPTNLAVYGTASDLDRNERVVVLLTPAVNRLTQPGENSFINGYFDSCDLVNVAECPDTNSGEVMYSVVPDPTGRWGLTHSVQSVVRLLPPLIAHELAHLIHFNQRALVSNIRSVEELWLSEAIAHFAEDTVASVLRSRGLTALADDLLRENLVRARFFLAAPEKTSLVASSGTGTLGERGAGWLFLKYLNQRAGGNLLRRLETSTQTGAASVTSIAGVPWMSLLRDWSVAVFAAGSPDLAGVTLPPEQTLGGFDLRSAVASVANGVFPLNTNQLSDGDFSVDWSFIPSSTSVSKLNVPPGTTVNLILAGERGGSFVTAAQPQVLILRLR